MAGVIVQGLERVILAFRNRAKRYQPLVTVVVSYGAEYALKVHEDLTATHKVGSAKFLEFAARTTTTQVAATVRQKITNGESMENSLLAGGYVVLVASNAVVPVDTGYLRASGRVDIR